MSMRIEATEGDDINQGVCSSSARANGKADFKSAVVCEGWCEKFSGGIKILLRRMRLVRLCNDKFAPMNYRSRLGTDWRRDAAQSRLRIASAAAAMKSVAPAGSGT